MTIWTNSIIELLDKLKHTSPESGGLVHEIYYWRDIDRVLEAANKELDQKYVKNTIKILELGKECRTEL